MVLQLVTAVGHVVTAVGHALLTVWALFWESIYGLALGFVLSAIVQVLIPPRVLHRYAGGSASGIAAAAAFGVISSSCSYSSAAAARALYRRGADARATFSFLVSSTNMNIAILIMFWVLVGWQFAFAEFFGGLIIIAVISVGLTLFFHGGALERLRRESQAIEHQTGEVVNACAVCGMQGQRQHHATYGQRRYLFCSAEHARQFTEHPDNYLGASAADDDSFDRPAIGSIDTWAQIAQVAWGDVQMLRGELLTGYVLAGFAEAWVPREWLSHSLASIGGIPVVGYVLLLLLGLLIAISTFVCSMGNVPVAAFLKAAGAPLGATTSYIYGDLLILPLVNIYRKSFAPRLVAAFLGLFVVGACLAGAVMEIVIPQLPGGPLRAGEAVMAGMHAGLSFETVANTVALVVAAVLAGVWWSSRQSEAEQRSIEGSRREV